MTEYTTRAEWTGGHAGVLRCSNGPSFPFRAPEKLKGEAGVLTPEDAFVGSLNTCFMLMFIWAAERLKIGLVSYSCDATGFVEDRLDRTSRFGRLLLRPRIVARGCTREAVERALRLAEKYSLVWQSVNAEVKLEPEISLAEK